MARTQKPPSRHFWLIEFTVCVSGLGKLLKRIKFCQSEQYRLCITLLDTTQYVCYASLNICLQEIEVSFPIGPMTGNNGAKYQKKEIKEAITER